MRYFFIFLGCIICALSYAIFLIPHQIVPGGVTGIAMILHFLFSTPVGIITIVLNIPLFLWGMKIMGYKYGIQSVIAIACTNFLIDFFPT
jgi:Uncharacterized conserved protein